MTAKTQPWKAALPALQQKSAAASCPDGIEYGVRKGETAVVDGTAANVKPKAKSQPWKASWPPVEAQQQVTTACPNGIEYGVAKGDIAVVDGTAANVKPAKKKDETSA